MFTCSRLLYNTRYLVLKIERFDLDMFLFLQDVFADRTSYVTMAESTFSDRLSRHVSQTRERGTVHKKAEGGGNWPLRLASLLLFSATAACGIQDATAKHLLPP